MDGASTWSLTALALLIALKGLAWSISLSGFRGGPTFPGLLLGVAAGLLASHLPGFAMTPAVAVGWGRRWPPCCGCRSPRSCSPRC